MVIGCSECCRRKVLARLEGDLFERQTSLQAPVGITNEDKADGVVLYRGRRQVARKNYLRLDQSPPRRKRKRGPNIGDLFFQQRAMKVIIPKSHNTPSARHQLDPWLFRNINSDDRSMIDRPQHDLNRFGFEVSEMEEKGELHENEFVRIAFFFFFRFRAYQCHFTFICNGEGSLCAFYKVVILKAFLSSKCNIFYYCTSRLVSFRQTPTKQTDERFTRLVHKGRE